MAPSRAWLDPMQLRLPWADRAVPPNRSGHHLVISGREIEVSVARHRLARRYVVRVTESGSVRLTVPRGASIAGGLAFAGRQAEWIERQRQRQAQRAAPWVTGTPLRFRGDVRSLIVQRGAVELGPLRIARRASDRDVRTVVESFLRDLAERELVPRCLELARQTNVQIARAAVRNQRSRWGACSSKRVITLNWRLIQMPPEVSDYIIFHELMHVRQPNHSRRFWREVASVCAWWRDAERWLRKHGRELI
jgi:predicted metal-dependent hydrolase